MSNDLHSHAGDLLRRTLATPPMIHLLHHGFIAPAQQRLALALADPVAAQAATLARLLRHGAGTHFGREHGLTPGLTAAAFRARVPVHRYEDLAPYIDAIYRQGEPNVLWPGRVTRFAESTGTSRLGFQARS